ncbi:MAG: MBL fold metallo-hydrolase [Thermoplasmata archaeon]
MAEVLTGRLPGYVVTSHYHNDHIRGSQAFTEAQVVSTVASRELISTKGKAELEADRKQAPEQLAAMETAAQSEERDDRRLAAMFLPYWQGIQASLPEIRLRLPELTFEDQLTFHGTKRTAQLIAMGGHTESDCVMYLSSGKSAVLRGPAVRGRSPIPRGRRPAGLAL